MKYALSYIAAVAVILGVCGAIVGGVYHEACYGPLPTSLCKVDKE
jgi:hypothetical protein